MSNERNTDGRIRDPAVDAAWRAASTEEPASQSDAAVLAAARAEAGSRAGSRTVRRGTPWWVRWQPLVAAAGLAGLAFLVVQRLPTENDQTKSFEPPARSVPAAAAPGSEADNEAGASDGADVSIVRPAEGMQPKSTHVSADAPPPRPVEESARKNTPAERPSAQGRTEDLATAPALEYSAPVARQRAAGITAEKSVSNLPGPEAWVRRIVSLHATGNLLAAADELRAFRRAYPDADGRLPMDLQEWANTVDASVER